MVCGFVLVPAIAFSGRAAVNDAGEQCDSSAPSPTNNVNLFSQLLILKLFCNIHVHCFRFVKFEYNLFLPAPLCLIM